MKAIKYLFTMLLFVAMLPLSAQQGQQGKTKSAPNKPDPVVVNNVTFKKIPANDIFGSEGQWTRIEVELGIVGNPDEAANNQNWVRNIDVALTVLYKDEKAKGKSIAESMIAMTAKVRLFACKVSAKVPVVFYIPSEAYFVYRLSPEPYAWNIDIGVNGGTVPLTKDNYKKRLSKTIVKSSNLTQVLENYKKLVEKASTTNDGVLFTLPKAPFNVQWYEYSKSGNNMKIPTYLPDANK